jgi:hypothetical protein
MEAVVNPPATFKPPPCLIYYLAIWKDEKVYFVFLVLELFLYPPSTGR